MKTIKLTKTEEKALVKLLKAECTSKVLADLLDKIVATPKTHSHRLVDEDEEATLKGLVAFCARCNTRSPYSKVMDFEGNIIIPCANCGHMVYEHKKPS